MPYDIKTGTEVFQCSIEHLFTNQIVVDDILVYGRNQDEYDKKSKKVLDRERQLNLKLNPQTCKFHVTSESVHCDQSKISATNNLKKAKR